MDRRVSTEFVWGEDEHWWLALMDTTMNNNFYKIISVMVERRRRRPLPLIPSLIPTKINNSSTSIELIKKNTGYFRYYNVFFIMPNNNLGNLGPFLRHMVISEAVVIELLSSKPYSLSSHARSTPI
jgi:hypothetical protein